jgi:hypothetical protein
MKNNCKVGKSSAKFIPGSQYLNFHQAWVVSDVQNRQMFHFSSSYRTFVIISIPYKTKICTLFLVMVYLALLSNVFKALNQFCYLVMNM